MEIRHLRNFVAVAKAKNLNRAAKQIHLAQPALSRQIIQLEDELRVKLFVRKSSGVELTEGGKAFLEHAERLLLDLERAQAGARQASRREAGTLRVAFSELAVSGGIFPEAIRAFRRRQPHVSLNVTVLDSYSQIAAIRNGDIDVGFLFTTYRDEPGLAFEELAVYGWVVGMSAGHPLTRKKPLLLRDLQDEEIVWVVNRNPPPRFRRPLVSILDERGFRPRVWQEADTIETQLSLLAVGTGIGFVSTARLRRPFDGIVTRPLADLDLTLPYCMTYRRDEPSRTVQGFLCMVREIYATAISVRKSVVSRPTGRKAGAAPRARAGA